MFIKQRIRNWLGINDLVNNQANMNTKLDQIYSRFNATYGQIIAANRGMGRLLAKLDPQYAQDELDPDRKRKSDDIADQVIRKLIAEHVESNKLSGNN